MQLAITAIDDNSYGLGSHLKLWKSECPVSYYIIDGYDKDTHDI